MVVRQEVKKVSRRDQLCVVIHHDDLKTSSDDFVKLYAVKRYLKVTEEGSPDYFFDHANTELADEEGAPQALPQVVEDALNGQSNETNTLEALRGVVDIDIDDDNDPAPENIPAPTDNNDRVLDTEWKHHGHCFRRSANMANHKACLNFRVDPTRDDYFLQLFEGLFPMEVVQCIIDSVNDKLTSEQRLTHGEFLRWIGVWVLISTVDGSDRRAFWSTKKVDVFDGAPFHVTPYMSRRRFELILYNLGYTKDDPPQYKDRFWEVRWMLQEWNKNMGTNFSPSWINCIDESMSKWVNEFTCPGFMYVPRKPWPFGNEYHDAGCADCDIIWGVDLREGKDRPRNLGNKEFDEMGKTTGILL